MEFKTEPYAHQRLAFERFQRKRFFALFMEMGTGKSKAAIDIASSLFEDDLIDAVLLIAPNGVHRQWANEQLKEHSPVPYRKYIWDSKKHFSTTYRHIWEFFLNDPKRELLWFCTNVEYYSTFTYHKLFEDFLTRFRTFVIIDESTRIKNPKAKRTVNITKLGRKAECRAVLTGTPVTQSPIDIWAQFEFLHPNFFDRTYFVFQHHHVIMVKDVNPYSGGTYHRMVSKKEWALVKYFLEKGEDHERISAHTGVSEKNIEYIANKGSFSPYKNLEEIVEKIRPYSIFVRKEDCLDLPEKIYEKIVIEPSPEQKRVYNDLKKKLMAEYANKELTILNKVTLTLRLMQVCGGFFPSDNDKKPVMIENKNRKIVRLIEDLEEVGEERVIIWSHFVVEIEAIYEALTSTFPDWRVEKYYGKTEQKDREKIIHDFQKGEIKIMICNQQSASFGLNLQRSNLHYFFSNNFSLEQRLQAEDRSHRSGQKYPVCYKDILIEGTIEENIVEALQNKKNVLEAFRNMSIKEILDGKT